MAIEHHEDILQQIVDVGRPGAEALQRAVQVVDFSFEGVEARSSGFG
jgi:hypothetical protein